jgi:hypothetical protein
MDLINPFKSNAFDGKAHHQKKSDKESFFDKFAVWGTNLNQNTGL